MFDITHIHPMVVHFPIALLMVGFLADLASLLFTREKCFSTMGFYLEILGLLAVIVAFGTGYFLTGEMEGEAGHVRDQHELFATLTLITIIVASLVRVVIMYIEKEKTNLKYLFIGLFLLAAVFVGITGYLGGSLVMNYMIGI
ncbi:MAG: DUF2231 domain-containing protein [Bacteroidetes bacterium]|nr:DUF2231 domain-containing protein [Bacteroidota bacterium]